jgi:hypothetical protein
MGFQKGHKINVGIKRGPLPKWHKKRLSILAKKRKAFKANHWKGGQRKIRGYVLEYAPDHPHCIDNRYVLQHRLVMEKHIGRYLKKGEVIHHLNGIRHDNRIENLRLMKKRAHDSLSLKTRWKNGTVNLPPPLRNHLGQFKKQKH